MTFLAVIGGLVLITIVIKIWRIESMRYWIERSRFDDEYRNRH